MTKYLGHVLALQDDKRKTVTRILAGIDDTLSNPTRLEGLTGEYTPKDDEGEPLPPEDQRVQATVTEMIQALRGPLGALFDVTAARDFTNGSGRVAADIVLDNGDVLVSGAPVPYLLWLVKQLDDLQTFVLRLPTHSLNTEWQLVQGRGVYQSLPELRVRSVKHHEIIRIAEATAHHPAQAQVVGKDVIVGTWTRFKHHGGLPVARKEQILRRIASLRTAVEAARAVANRTEADEPLVGERLLSYVFDC